MKRLFRRLDVWTFGCLLFILHPSAFSLADPPPRVPLLTESPSDSANSATPQPFAAALADLPPLSSAGAPRVWGWGHRPPASADDPFRLPWNPANDEHLAYARVAGGIIADARLPRTVAAAAEVARLTGARLAIRLHPFPPKAPQDFWYTGPGADPRYEGAEVEDQLTYQAHMLWIARWRAGEVPIAAVIIDAEAWTRDKPRVDDRRAWNAAMLAKHQRIVDVIHLCLGPDIPIIWYNYSPFWKHLTLREPTTAASFSFYYPTDFPFLKERLRETITFQFARGLESTAVFISLDAGWQSRTSPRTWSWSHGTRPFESHRVGEILRGYRNWSVHDVIDYSAFHPDGHWPPHCLAFFRGLLGLPFEPQTTDQTRDNSCATVERPDLAANSAKAEG